MRIEEIWDSSEFRILMAIFQAALPPWKQPCVLRYTRRASAPPSQWGLGRHLPPQQKPAPSSLVELFCYVENIRLSYVGMSTGQSKLSIFLQVLLEDPL